MQFFTITQILSIYGLVLADVVGRTNGTPSMLTASFYPLPLANGSPLPTEATIQIKFGDLSGTAIITLTNSSVSTSRKFGNPLTFSETNTYREPYHSIASCATKPIFNATTASTGFAKHTDNINASTGSLGHPFATPTPTNPSLFTGEAISKTGRRNSFLSAIVALTYFL